MTESFPLPNTPKYVLDGSQTTSDLKLLNSETWGQKIRAESYGDLEGHSRANWQKSTRKKSPLMLCAGERWAWYRAQYVVRLPLIQKYCTNFTALSRKDLLLKPYSFVQTSNI